MATTKLKAKTKQMMLDARIRSEYRWYVRRKKNDAVDAVAVMTNDQDNDGVNKAAQAVHDDVVSSFDYNQVLVDAVETLGDDWGPKYVAKVIRAGLKSGAIQAEAAEMDGFITEASNWIANAIKKPGALRKTAGAKKGEKIPTGKLKDMVKNKKAKKTAKRAQLALTLQKFRKK